MGAFIPNGTLLNTLYSSWGIVFGPTQWATDYAGIATSLPNRCTSGGAPGSSIDCYFPGGVSAVGSYGFDFVLTVFDVHDTPLGTIGYTDGTAGIFGGAQELGFLGLTSATPIHHARFGLYWNQQVAYGFELDDLRFVPIPSATSAHRASFGKLKRGR